MESQLPSVIEFLWSDRNTDSEMTLMYGGMRIHITISAENLEESPTVRERYIHFLAVAENFELDGLTVDDLYDWVIAGAMPELLKLSSVPPEPVTLQDYIYAPTMHYTLRASSDNGLFISHTVKPCTETVQLGVHISEEFCSPWPCYEPSQIRICKDHNGPAPPPRMPRKVISDGGQVSFFKPYRFCDAHLAEHELQQYSRVRAAELENVLISRAFGLVRGQSGILLGLLLTHIDSGAVTLACAVRAETPHCLRVQWERQISATLERLHRAGIVWGDAKPDNVLIDRHENAWIIDFGGGYTQGWVESDMAGTIEGDRQGLCKIIDFIHS